MRAHAAAGAWIALLTGCGSRILLVPVPDATGASAAIVVATIELDIRAIAVELTEARLPPLSFEVEADEGEDAFLEVFLYRRTLAELGATAGAFAGAAAGGTPLSKARGFVARRSLQWKVGAEPGAWIDGGQESLAAEQLRLPPDPDPCEDFNDDYEAVRLQLGASCTAAFLYRIDDQRALVGSGDGAILLVSIEGAQRIGQAPQTPLPNNRSSAITAGALTSSTVLWVTDNTGMLSRFDFPNATAAQAITRTSTYAIWWLAGGVSGATTEIFALSWLGGLERVVPERSERRWIGRFPGRAGDDDEHFGGVVWLGPGEAIAASPSSKDVMRVREAVLSWEPVPSAAGFVGIAQIEGFGTVLGNSEGTLFTDQGGSWHALEGAREPAGLFPLAFGRFANGFVFGGSLGGFRQYVPGHGLCAETFGAGFTIRHIAAVGDDLVLTGGEACEALTPLLWLRRKT
ncbi:MAG: hypothetical protein IT384_09695 [Deltaproteobacteria bacterium]|nr:hypothetical protein [Deltaproteobacteria bacterium]